MSKLSIAIPGPHDILRRELSNGLVVLVRENFTSPAVVVSGYVSAGSISDGPDKAGLASFTAALLDRGTSSRSYEEISETVEGLGATFVVKAGRHRTTFGTKSLSEDLPTVLDVLADVLQCPVFPAEHVERVRGQWLTDLQERDHDTRRMAALAFREALYAGHPYGRSTSGYEETARAISRDDVLRFYAQNYRPQGGVVAIVGAVKTGRAMGLIEEAFLGWHEDAHVGETTFLPPDPHPVSILRRDVTMEGKTQSDIVLGNRGLDRMNRDYYAALVANTVLGRFGMYGRLGLNVREKQGLAYYCLSTMEAGTWPGPWYVFAGVNPANVQRAVDSIRQEIARLCTEPVPQTELADTKAFLTGSLPLRLEANEGVAATLVAIERYGLGLDYLSRYAGLIESVSAEDVKQVAGRYLDPDRYAIAVAGPPLSS